MNDNKLKIKKPTFLIIGSAKCGTTALASILKTHPDCCMSDPKEVSFFQDTIDFQTNSNFTKGWKWYQKAFSHYKGEPVVGEATPSYADRSRSPNTARRVYEFNSNMKIIYMVRDPLERQISLWKMQYDHGKGSVNQGRREDKWALKGFNYWMQMQRDVQQWDECRYAYQISAYEQLFLPSNIYISFLDSWRHSKENEVHKIMRFLGLDPKFYQESIFEETNRSSERKIDRPFLRKVRTQPAFQSIISKLPISWREWGRNNLAKTSINPPSIDLSNEMRIAFFAHIKRDLEKFLTSHGRDHDFWVLK